MNRWKGRVALVTGATRGIGATISQMLVDNGINVVGCARNIKNVEKRGRVLPPDLRWYNIFIGPCAITFYVPRKKHWFPTRGKFHLVKCDVSKENEVLTMFDEIRRKFDHIDIFINNAGIIEYAPIMNGNMSAWRNLMEVNVLGMCLCTREAVKLMNEKKVSDGIIIQVGGIGGHKIPSIPKGIPDTGVAVYNGTKFMVRALTEALRQELKSQDSRIRVSAISPGPVHTAMLTKAMIDAGYEVYPKLARYLLPEDVAEAVSYILSCKNHVNVDDIVIQSLDFHV